MCTCRGTALMRYKISVYNSKYASEVPCKFGVNSPGVYDAVGGSCRIEAGYLAARLRWDSAPAFAYQVLALGHRDATFPGPQWLPSVNRTGVLVGINQSTDEATFPAND